MTRKFLPPVRTLLSALAYTGAQALVDLARQLDSSFPDMIFVTKEPWCYLPDRQHLVLETNAIPDKVISLSRYRFVTISVVEHPHEPPFAIVTFNYRESALVMYGRDPEGYPLDVEDYDSPRTSMNVTPKPEADMEALLRAARASDPDNWN